MSRYWTHTLSYADLYLQGGQKLFLKFLTTMYDDIQKMFHLSKFSVL